MVKNRKIKTLALITLIGTSFSNIAHANEIELGTKNTEYKIAESKNQVDYAGMIADGDLEDLMNQVDAHHKDNPELSFDELNEYFKSLIVDSYETREINKNPSEYYSVETKGAADYLPVVSSRLTAPEKKVFNSNPLKGANVLLFAKQANSMTDTAFKKGYNRTWTNADAFRHAMWNALMAQSPSVGPTYAKQFADAHEIGYPITSENPKIARDMDYANNASGRSIGQRGYSGSQTAITNAIRSNVLSALKNGSLKRFKGSDIGQTSVLVRTNSLELR